MCLAEQQPYLTTSLPTRLVGHVPPGQGQFVNMLAQNSVDDLVHLLREPAGIRARVQWILSSADLATQASSVPSTASINKMDI